VIKYADVNLEYSERRVQRGSRGGPEGFMPAGFWKKAQDSSDQSQDTNRVIQPVTGQHMHHPTNHRTASEREIMRLLQHNNDKRNARVQI
jgi:hypothetical protein